jgi:hypothetical protein
MIVFPSIKKLNPLYPISIKASIMNETLIGFSSVFKLCYLGIEAASKLFLPFFSEKNQVKIKIEFMFSLHKSLSRTFSRVRRMKFIIFSTVKAG